MHESHATCCTESVRPWVLGGARGARLRSCLWRDGEVQFGRRWPRHARGFTRWRAIASFPRSQGCRVGAASRRGGWNTRSGRGRGTGHEPAHAIAAIQAKADVVGVFARAALALHGPRGTLAAASRQVRSSLGGMWCRGRLTSARGLRGVQPGFPILSGERPRNPIGGRRDGDRRSPCTL